MSHIVTVTYKDHFQIIKMTSMLQHSKYIRHHLARMVEVGESIDYRNRGILAEIQNMLMIKHSCHDNIVVAREKSGDVRRNLPFSHTDICR